MVADRLREMMERIAQPGRVVWIGVRPQRRAVVASIASVTVTNDGLEGDHGRNGPRAVTLIQCEHLAAVGSFLGRGPVQPGLLRRNFVVEGVNLVALKDREVRIGGAVLRIVGPCMPCSRMEDALGPGGYAAMRGHGGWCAEVVSKGQVSIGDRVAPQ